MSLEARNSKHVKFKNIAIEQIFFYWRSLFMAYFRFFHFSLKCGPYIIDPANPTNNLYDEVKCWPLVKKVAEETTQKPLLRHVRVSADWKSEEPRFY